MFQNLNPPDGKFSIFLAGINFVIFLERTVTIDVFKNLK